MIAAARSPLGARVVVYLAACGLTLPLVADLQVPALSRPLLAALALISMVPPLLTIRLGRRASLAGQLAVLVVILVLIAGSLHPSALMRPLAQLPEGVEQWFAVTLPYDPSERAALRSIVLVALVTLLSALAWSWLARPRPLLAAALALVPFAIGTTVYALGHPILRGAVALAIAIAFLACDRLGASRARSRSTLQTTAIAGIAGVTLAVLFGSGTTGGLDWTTWRIGAASDARVGVRYVWDQSYAGLRWPDEPTDVFSVRAAEPAYWRATVLEQFDGARFSEAPVGPDAVTAAPGTVLATRQTSRATQRVTVTIRALDEPYLLAPGQPVRYEVPSGSGLATLLGDSAARLLAAPPTGARYRVSTAEANPSPTELRTLGAGYPSALAVRELRFADAQVPAWGTPGRDRAMATLFRDHAAGAAWTGWQRAYRFARSVTADATTPYQAVALLEARLHARTYDDAAALPNDPGALARFAVSGEPGYCQMYSASLAALTRLLGIPARIAEGFTPGRLGSDGYVVSDRDAHAWVEVWFPGPGWVAFEPTPTRTLPGRTSTSSKGFALPSLGTGRHGPITLPQLPRVSTVRSAARVETAASTRWMPSQTLVLVLLLPVLALLALLGGKRALVRRGGGGPAARARARLVAFARDQGLDLADALTNAELAAAVELRFGVPAAGWARASDRVRFGAATGAREERELVAALDAILRAIRRQVGRRSRVRGAFSLRSLRAGAVGLAK